MGKVREHVGNDTEALSHWLGRKIKNHQPMTSRDAGGRNPVKVFVNPVDHTDVRYSLRDGRQYRLKVEEVQGDDMLAEGTAIVT